MRRLLCVSLLGVVLGVLVYGAGAATASGPFVTTTHFTASYSDWTGAHYSCWGARTVSQPAVDPGGSGGSAPATVLEKELCLADTTSAWFVRPAGTYTVQHGLLDWISDCDGRWASSGTLTIVQRVPGVQLWSIVAWY